jgi:hypothetical protein
MFVRWENILHGRVKGSVFGRFPSNNVTPTRYDRTEAKIIHSQVRE